MVTLVGGTQPPVTPGDALADPGTPGAPPRAPRRGVVLLTLLALLVVLGVLGDRAAQAREERSLLDRAAQARSAVTYTDGRIRATYQYASPSIVSPRASAEVRRSLQGLVQDAARTRLAPLQAQRDRAAAVRVLPWHPAEREARDRLVAYLDARLAYVTAITQRFRELYQPHPALDATLEQARSAYLRAAPDAQERITEVFGLVR